MGSPLARALDLELRPDMFRRRLDDADALPVGSGQLELRGLVRPGLAGASLEYAHHIGGGLSAFGFGYAGASAIGLEYGAAAGVRVRW